MQVNRFAARPFHTPGGVRTVKVREILEVLRYDGWYQ
jgi:hypothetical protein